MNTVNGVRLQWFESKEFIDQVTKIDWSNRMCPRLLVLLDAIRSAWHAKIKVSNGANAIGRTTGSSDHNWKLHGQVRGIDVVPEACRTRYDAERFIHFAKLLGFTSIGIYPQWRQGCGFHLGTRDQNHISTWGYIDGQYCTLQQALDTMQ